MPRTTLPETNFDMFSGDLRVIRCTVLDQNEDVVDLTGLSGAAFVVAKRHGAAKTIDKTLGSGIVVTSAVEGVLEVTLSSADTEPLRGAYVHELSITDAALRKTTVLFGSITMRVNTP